LEASDQKTGEFDPGPSTRQGRFAWVTNTVTLIYGERDAVLVDTFLSVQHSKELVDWVAESGQNPQRIYITHAHGDHFFGLKLLLDRCPNARAFATLFPVAGHAKPDKPGFHKVLLGAALSWPGPIAVAAQRSSTATRYIWREKN
jgi:glyoxylase-like metal-dependent hydrolase (beta-lactamase superfamily II)